MTATTKLKKIISEYFFDESAFRVLYILALFLTSICCIEVTCQTFTGIFMFWALFILIRNFRNGKYKIKKDYLYIALIFFISSVISCLFYAGTNLHLNMMFMYHIFICFFLFYAMFQTCEFKKISREFVVIFRLIIIITTVFSILGLAIMFMFSTVDIGNYSIGLRDNRYTGLYTNPNLSAFYNAIALIACHILLIYQKKLKKKLVKTPLVICCFVFNIINLFLSDSNSSLIFVLLYAFVYGFVLLFTKQYNKPKLARIKNMALFFICFCVAGVAIYFIRIQCQNLVSQLMNNIRSTQISTEPKDTMIVIGRAASKYEVTSGRLDSLIKAFILLLKFPIFGIGKANIFEYGNRYLTRGFLFSDLHNGYMTILLSCGIVGFVLFTAFSICVASRVFHFALLKTKGNNVLIAFLAFLVSYCAFSVSEKGLLLDLTFMVVIFWLILGYTMSYINHYYFDRIDDKGENFLVSLKGKSIAFKTNIINTNKKFSLKSKGGRFR